MPMNSSEVDSEAESASSSSSRCSPVSPRSLTVLKLSQNPEHEALPQPMYQVGLDTCTLQASAAAPSRAPSRESVRRVDFEAAGFSAREAAYAIDECDKVKVCLKKPYDLVAMAKKRVRMRIREEVRAARRARRQERKRAKLRRGADQDLESFLLRTKERLETSASQAAADAARAASSEAEEDHKQRCAHSGVDGETAAARARERVIKKMEAAALKKQAAEAAESAEAKEKIEEFRKMTRDRVVQRLLSKLPQVKNGLITMDVLELSRVNAFPRRRIAVIGAGPVGLWAALLLAKKYARGCGLGRRPDAPEVHVMEARSEDSHCSRTDIRIALSAQTQQLLNLRSHSRCFVSGMPVADIESSLLRSLQRIVPQQAPTFNCPAENPADLAASGRYDCILWAGGRRSLCNSLRHALKCEARVGAAERVLVFQLNDLACSTDIRNLATTDLTGIARQAAACSSLRVMVRPGLGSCAGWLWLFGIPTDVVPSASMQPVAPMRTMHEALDTVLDSELSGSVSVLHCAVEVLQQRVRPTSCSVRWVEAAFWSSDHVVCDLTPLGGSEAIQPLLLLGDAACGRPFYTGTTLNRHFWDVAALVDEVDWIHDGSPFTASRFEGHERRYQAELLRVEEYHRRADKPPPPPPIPEAPPQPPSERHASFPTSPQESPLHGKQSPSPPIRGMSPKARSLPVLERVCTNARPSTADASSLLQ